MAWKECSLVQSRKEFVTLAMAPDCNMALLCRRFGVSRRTGYKWLDRYKEAGDEGLSDRSRRPHHSPLRTGEPLRQRVIQLRSRHPAWGGRKLARRLATLGEPSVPAPSTISGILSEAGLIDPPADRPATRRYEHERPNDQWQMDYKGHVPMRCGNRCHPLTVLDDHSRYSLVLRACDNEQAQTVKTHLTEAFLRYGLPRRILADNGSPWGTSGWCNGPAVVWTHLDLWLARLGVKLIHGRPGHPQTQGKEERFHRTLNAEVLRWRCFEDLADAQRQLDHWREIYNSQRPHEALGMQVPAQRYSPSPRAFPAVLPAIEYDSGDTIRKVRSDGRVKIQQRMVTIGSALSGEPVALRATREDGVWDVYYCQVQLGRVDLRQEGSEGRLLPHRPLAPLAGGAAAE